MLILGIDLGKFKSVACSYRSETASVVRYRTLSTSPLEFARLLQEERPDLVVIEACSAAGWVYDLCRARGIRCLVAHTGDEAWRWKNVKRKTDRDDALKLCRMAALGQLPQAHMPTRAVRQKRSLLKHRQNLVARRVALQNSLRAAFQQQGINLDRGHRAWTAKGLEFIRSEARPIARCSAEELWRGLVHQELEALEHTVLLLQDLESQLDAMAKQDPAIQRLETIPGVGTRTAEVLTNYLDQPNRFANGRKVSSYGGLVPKRFQSGQMDRQGRISRRGPALLRKVLVEAAWLMVRYNPWAARLVNRISKGQKNRRKQAVVAVARKLLVRGWAMLRDDKPWQENPQAKAVAAGV